MPHFYSDTCGSVHKKDEGAHPINGKEMFTDGKSPPKIISSKLYTYHLEWAQYLCVTSSFFCSV